MGGMTASVSEAVKIELSKYFGNKDHKDLEDPFSLNCAYEFASNVFFSSPSSSRLALLPSPSYWVINSSVISHMCSTKGQIQSLQQLNVFKAVSLPDGSLQLVKEALELSQKSLSNSEMLQQPDHCSWFYGSWPLLNNTRLLFLSHQS